MVAHHENGPRYPRIRRGCRPVGAATVTPTEFVRCGRVRRPTGVHVLTALALLCAASPAVASSLGNAELRVTRTAHAMDCVDEQALAAAVLALGSIPDTPAEPLSISVNLDRRGHAYGAVIEASGRKQGRRELRASSTTCKQLSDAVAVAVAIAIPS